MPPARKNKYESLLKKDRLEQLMRKAGYYVYVDLFRDWAQYYGFNLQYKAFGALLNNYNRWSVTYAHSLAQFLGVTVEDLFELKKVVDDDEGEK